MLHLVLFKLNGVPVLPTQQRVSRFFGYLLVFDWTLRVLWELALCRGFGVFEVRLQASSWSFHSKIQATITVIIEKKGKNLQSSSNSHLFSSLMHLKSGWELMRVGWAQNVNLLALNINDLMLEIKISKISLKIHFEKWKQKFSMLTLKCLQKSKNFPNFGSNNPKPQNNTLNQNRVCSKINIFS
jgi:hypothetical protein